jgi:uncharacterized protein
MVMSNLQDLLRQFIREGSVAAMVVSWDGFLIEGVSKSDEAVGVGLEAIGAVISTSIGSTEVIGRELNVGAVKVAMFEFEKGTVLVKILGSNGILAVLVDPGANLGLPRLQIRKLSPDIEAALGA